jgi:hypothetical protein
VETSGDGVRMEFRRVPRMKHLAELHV